jgi:transcription elongation factor Elf1
MSELTTFFRHCPSCGRRFEIRLIGKKVVGERHETGERPFSYVPYNPSRSFPPYSANYNEVTESVPLTVDIKEFQYAYSCKHCGHRWSEIR